MRVQYQKLRNMAHTVSLWTFSLIPKDVTFIFYLRGGNRVYFTHTVEVQINLF